MSSYKKRPDFYNSDEGIAVANTLREMAGDTAFLTDSSYTANSTMYPDNLIPFVKKHMDYLNAHPSTNPQQYLANLRLMTRIR